MLKKKSYRKLSWININKKSSRNWRRNIDKVIGGKIVEYERTLTPLNFGIYHLIKVHIKLIFLFVKQKQSQSSLFSFSRYKSFYHFIFLYIQVYICIIIIYYAYLCVIHYDFIYWYFDTIVSLVLSFHCTIAIISSISSSLKFAAPTLIAFSNASFTLHT